MTRTTNISEPSYLDERTKTPVTSSPLSSTRTMSTESLWTLRMAGVVVRPERGDSRTLHSALYTVQYQTAKYSTDWILYSEVNQTFI